MFIRDRNHGCQVILPPKIQAYKLKIHFFFKVFVVCKICFWPDCHRFLFTPKVNPRRILDFQKYFRDGILLGSTNSEIRASGCENPLVCGSEGCFLLANWGKTSRSIRKHCNVEGSIAEQAAATWGNQQKQNNRYSSKYRACYQGTLTTI